MKECYAIFKKPIEKTGKKQKNQRNKYITQKKKLQKSKREIGDHFQGEKIIKGFDSLVAYANFSIL